MNIHFYILFALTFFTGAVAGAVLYVGAFAPAYQPAAPPPASERAFELRGERFTAGCLASATGCDRFTFTEDRRLTRFANGEERPTVRVTSAYMRELTAAIQDTPLAEIQSESVECQSFERVGEQYLLIYKGEVYTLHSCSETFQTETLSAFFEQIWTEEVPITSAPAPLFEEGVTGSMQRYLRSHFDRNGE